MTRKKVKNITTVNKQTHTSIMGGGRENVVGESHTTVTKAMSSRALKKFWTAVDS